MNRLSQEQHVQLLFVILVSFVCMIYAMITNHIWEDFFITFKHSKNLVEGNGLVYHPGEPVHGFTSVINTLLPAFFYWITGKSLIASLWLYRVASIIALAVGGFFLLREIQRKNPDNLIVPVFFILFFAFQTKTVMFTTNGQEAGFMMLFLLPSIVFAFYGFKDNWRWAGICWAGLLYTRPDGAVYILLLAITSMLMSQHRSRDDVIAIIKAGLVCTVLYLPWFIGVWLYYGTPIPHTITAKAGLGPSFSQDIIVSLQTILSLVPKIGSLVFTPTYHHFGGWPYWVKVYAFLCWLVCFFYWLIPSEDKLGRFVSFLFSLLILYFSFLQFRGAVYPWYLPPAAIMGAFILISALFNVSRQFTSVYKPLTIAIASVFLLASVSVLVMTTKQIAVQQDVIENGHRTQIGLWLNKHKQENDSVFLEPLGYIGYFSNAKMLDWPGLVAPEVVAAEKNKSANSYENILRKLTPDWLVLRPYSLKPLTQSAWFNEHYKPVQVFDARKKLEQHKDIAGMGYLQYDAMFIILKKI